MKHFLIPTNHQDIYHFLKKVVHDYNFQVVRFQTPTDKASAANQWQIKMAAFRKIKALADRFIMYRRYNATLMMVDLEPEFTLIARDLNLGMQGYIKSMMHSCCMQIKHEPYNAECFHKVHKKVNIPRLDKVMTTEADAV